MSTNQSLIPANPTDMMSVAKNLAESGYFQDAKAASQAFVKVLAGAELGLPPFQAMSGIHVISGKPVLGAGLIASIIKRSGKYDYRVKETTETVCSIEFFQGADSIGVSTFTLEQAKKAQVKNLDKFAQNMLFARAISNGAKWFTPDVFGGPVYTDGEIEPIVYSVQDTSAEIVHEAKPTAPAPVTYTKQQQAENSQAFLDWQNGIDTLPSLAESWTKHVADLKALKGIKAEEKMNLFNRLKDIAFEKGFDYDETNKEFYAAEPSATAEEGANA